MWQVWSRGEVHSKFGGEPEGRDHLEDLGIDGRIILKLIFKWGGKAWTRLMWLSVGTGNRHL
jgi:hypothetical protein